MHFPFGAKSQSDSRFIAGQFCLKSLLQNKIVEFIVKQSTQGWHRYILKHQTDGFIRTNRFSAIPMSATQTVIALPGFNIKSYYASKNCADGDNAILRSAAAPDDVINLMNQSSGKRGQFYLCFALERMPSETVITTHILGKEIWLLEINTWLICCCLQIS